MSDYKESRQSCTPASFNIVYRDTLAINRNAMSNLKSVESSDNVNTQSIDTGRGHPRTDKEVVVGHG